MTAFQFASKISLLTILLVLSCKTRNFNKGSEIKVDVFQESSNKRTGIYAVVPFYRSGESKNKETKIDKDPWVCIYGSDFKHKPNEAGLILQDNSKVVSLLGTDLVVLLPKGRKYQYPFPLRGLKKALESQSDHRDNKIIAESILAMFGFIGANAGNIAVGALINPGVGFAIASGAIGVAAGAMVKPEISRAVLKDETICKISESLETIEVSAEVRHTLVPAPGPKQGLSKRTVLNEVMQSSIDYIQSPNLEQAEFGPDFNSREICLPNLSLAMAHENAPCGKMGLPTNIDLKFEALENGEN